jgi:hypothetical protein
MYMNANREECRLPILYPKNRPLVAKIEPTLKP